MIARVLPLMAAAAVLAGCTSSGAPITPSAPPRSSGATQAPTTAAAVPVHLHAVRTRACRLARTGFVRSTMGMRLGRITALRNGGHTVGCRFYALQHSPLHISEHLPGPHQPVVEILTRRYPTPLAAHNAFVLLSRKGTNAQRVDLGHHTGVCFQTDFYPKDHGADWACAANVGRTEVAVRTVDTTGTFSTAAVTRAVLRRV